MGTMPKATLCEGASIEGFTLESVQSVEEVRSVAYRFVHDKTGAKVLHLHSEDPENLFSVSFPTPPPDSTGVPHIIEHSVLAGSRRFPVRDPFFEMVKMSMATFINAMTGADCTYYPVCSNVKQDLFNLAEVYFDAVFHPLLTENTLKKEGHHLIPADDQDPLGKLKLNGIVYNEMKSYFSMPETLLYYRTGKLLFPEGVYGRNSGGDPDVIPDLTYEEFKGFYELSYHPSNAHFVLYGDIPTTEYLGFLGERLAPFTRGRVPEPIAREPRWSAPRQDSYTYPTGAEDDTAEKTYVLLSWLVGHADDPAEATAMSILSAILLGNEAAPLKKAVIASKLGQDLIASGSSSSGCELTFSVGIKGSEPDRGEAFEECVISALEHLADETFDASLVEAAFQQAAYSSREIGGMFPLSIMSRVMHSWSYNRDPLAFLNAGAKLDACRDDYAKNPRLFNELLREKLIDNTHRLRVVLAPDPGMQVKIAASFEKRMERVRASFSDEQMHSIAEQAAEMQRQAGTPNSPEALETLPQLTRSDLPPKPCHIPTSTVQLCNNVTLLENDIFSNGVNYLRLQIDLSDLPPELWPCIPRFTAAVNKLGAAGMDYETMARRVSSSTGGVAAIPVVSSRTDAPDQPIRGLIFAIRALDEQIEPALGVLHDLIFALDPRDKSRLHDVVQQSLASCRTRLVQEALGTATLHAGRGMSPEGWIAEQMRGLPQLPLLEQNAAEFETAYEAIAGQIEAIRDHLPGARGFTASFTGSSAANNVVRSTLKQWGERMQGLSRPVPAIGFVPNTGAPREGLAAPLQVSHCVQLVRAPHASHPDSPFIDLACALLRVDYMVHELRFKGNAYGASCSYADGAGQLTLSSYADPHIVRTLKVFAALPDYVRKASWSTTELDRAIISTAKHFIRPIRPESATAQALSEALSGRTRESKEQRYETILAATSDDVRRAILETLDANLSGGPICVASSRDKLDAANKEMPDAPLKIEGMLRP